MKKGGWSGLAWWASVVGMTAALAARLPELGPAWDARNAPQTAAEEAGGRVEGREDDGGHQNGSERPLWWRRWFGG